MAFSYDTSKGRLSTALTLLNTVVPVVLVSREFWFFFILHLSVFFAFRWGFIDAESVRTEADYGLNWSFAKLVSGIASFVQVFYANQCYSRYQYLYKIVKGQFDDALSFAFLLQTHIGYKSLAHVRLGVRYLISALVLYRDSLLDSLPSQGSVNDLVSRGLLRPGEADLLRNHKTQNQTALLFSWAGRVACSGLYEVGAPNNIHSAMSAALLRTQLKQTETVETRALPVPFQYYHLLCVMMVSNLAMWAYSMGLTNSIFAPVVFFCASLISNGLMELSSQLSDPFGDDPVDFPMDDWLMECVRRITEFSECPYPGGSEGLQAAIEDVSDVPRWQPLRSSSSMLEVMPNDDVVDGSESGETSSQDPRSEATPLVSREKTRLLSLNAPNVLLGSGACAKVQNTKSPSSVWSNDVSNMP